MKTKNPLDYYNPMAELAKAKYKIVFIVGLITMNILLHPPFIISGLAIILYIIIEDLITHDRTARAKALFINLLKKIVTAVLFLTGVYFLFKLAGGFGVLGFILAFILLGGFVIFLRRKKYLSALRHMEVKIWGRPLDRKEWNKGELKELRYKLK